MYTLDSESLGKRLKYVRTLKEVTAKELAKKCKTSASMIRRYERGELYPGLKRIVQMAELYGVSVDYLIGRDEQYHTLGKGRLKHSYKWVDLAMASFSKKDKMFLQRTIELTISGMKADQAQSAQGS